MATTQRDKKKRKIRYSDAKKTVADQERGFVPTAFTVPKGMKLFKFEEAKKYRLRVLPYIVGKGNPFKDEGEAHYERSHWQHRYVFPDDNNYCCPLRNSKKPCPVCEDRQRKMRQEGADKDALDDLKPKHRQLWVVEDLDNKEAGYQLLEAAFYGKDGSGFGQMINSLIEAADDGDPVTRFFHLKGGMILKIMTKKDNFQGNTFYKPIRIDAIPAKNDYPEETIDKIPCLDDLIQELPYKELKKLYEGKVGKPKDEDEEQEDEDTDTDTDDEGDDEEEAPKKKPGKKPKPDDEEEDDAEEDEEAEEQEAEDEEEGGENPAEARGIKVGTKVKHEDHGECEVVHVSGDGTAIKIKDEDGKTHKAIDPNDCDVVEEDEDEDEDEDDDADSDDDESSEDDDSESDSDDDSDDESDDDSDEEEDDSEDADDDEEGDDDESGPLSDEDDEEEKPRPRKKPVKKPAKKPAKKPGKK